MNSKSVTKAMIAVALALLIGWDIYVAANGIEGDTISELTLGWAHKHPVLPFALGFIAGHLFWPNRPATD